MAEPPSHDVAVPLEPLLTFAGALLTQLDVPAADAALTASILLDADLRGVESHGMAHLVTFYVRRLQRGEINPRPHVTVVRETPATATIDGDRGLGFVVGHRAMERAIEKAHSAGAGWVSVMNSTHYGAGAYYAMMALEHDMIGFSMTTGGRLMAAPGGRGRAVGLNVLAVAAPTPRGFPYVLDMSTSVVAAGKLEVAARRGRAVPEGWAADREGRPLTDPTRLHPDGVLLPLGGRPETGAYKGFGLALLVDVLSGALSGHGTTPEVDGGITAAHCFGALRIAAFQPLQGFLDAMGRMIDALKATPALPGFDEVRLPGELEDALAAQRRAAGRVPLHPSVLEGFRAVAEELDLPFDLPDDA